MFWGHPETMRLRMSDAAIARKLNLVRSTVCEHRTRSLELLKNTMEEYGYENYR